MQANGTLNRRSTSLSDMSEMTPAVDPAEALRRNLAVVLMDSIKESDIEGIGKSLVEKAKAGDRHATKLLLDLVTRSAGGTTVEKTVAKEKTVFVESAGKRQLQRLVAHALLTNGSMSVEALSSLCELTPEKLSGILDSNWFRSDSSGVSLTTLGKQAVG